MSKVTVTLSELQLLYDASAKCLTEEFEDYKLRIAFAYFKRDAESNLGPESPLQKLRTDIFARYGDPVEGGYSIPSDPEKRSKLISAIEQAMSEKVSVRFPELTIEIIEKAKLPMNASSLSILISLGILKEE
jgi:hypothetical protein